MRKAIYNSAIPKANLKSVKQSSCRASRFRFAFWLGLVLSTTAAFAADWSAAEQQLAKKIVAVTGPGTLSLTVENHSSLGRRDSDLVQNGLRSALEQSGIHFAKSDQAAASVALTLSENENSYVWVAEIHQGAGESAIAMVSVPRSGRSGAASESMPITLRKIPLWAQDGRILDVAVLEENGTPSRIAVLGGEDVSVYHLQNGKWQIEQTLQTGHTRPWPLDVRGRLVPTMDHTLSAYLPGVICRMTVTAVPLTMTCHGSDDPWPIVSGTMTMNSSVFPSAGSSTATGPAVPALAGFFASTRNYFTGVLSPAVGKFSTVPKFYTAAFVPRETYTLWLFASADGKVHMPDGAKAGEKFPALLEYLPYRKDDGTAAGDYPKHTYFARRGFVSARVDIRGFGTSEGVPPEREYSEQEQADGEQVIAWLAHQAWSNGNVGMFGISWGGFTALQMAMRHAPGLKAIIAVDATAELFHDDVHYIDGMAHIDEFELNMDMAEGWVGAPDYSLDEKVLGPRFDSPPWSLLYLKHQKDGAFWRDRVRPLSEITIPSFLIGGLQDGYRDNVPDMNCRASMDT